MRVGIAESFQGQRSKVSVIIKASQKCTIIIRTRIRQRAPSAVYTVSACQCCNGGGIHFDDYGVEAHL